MSLKKLIKKLGYGVAIHYNSYSKIYEVYKLGDYHPGSGVIKGVSQHKKVKRAIKKYLKKKYIK
jgi:hypothetical protein